ncbi:MAG: hypothetical protein Kow0020_02860 [Wenzhouxiangellaceae bacterium]
MQKSMRTVLRITVLMSLSHAVAALDIIQDRHNFDSQINFFSPVGQTFTAEDAAISTIGIWLNDCNTHFSDNPLDFRLYSGSGTSGALLAQQTLAVPPGHSNYFDVDFSGTGLTIGNTYTIEVFSPNARRCFQENVFSQPNPGPDYTGGAILYQGSVNAARGDMQFRVIVDPHAELATEISLSQNAIDSGETMTVTGTVRNVMGNIATGAEVDISLSGSATALITSFTSSTGCTAFPCALGDLAPGDSATVTATIRAFAAGSLNVAVLASSQRNDLDPADNTAPASFVVNPSADVKVELITPEFLPDTGTVRVDLVVSNAQFDTANPLVISDVLNDLVAVSWSCSSTGGAICASGGSGDVSDTPVLPPGGAVTYVITGNVVDSDGDFLVELAATANDAAVSDPNPGNNSAVRFVATGLFGDGFEASPFGP